MAESGDNGFSRRAVLQGAGVGVAAMMLPQLSAAQPPAPRWKRWNVTSPEGRGMLVSYQRAISAMLARPPQDPLNWYRNALIHTVDCPHGNWWFLPWHRGYVGWFEQICRELSGNPDFAFPYWDWTVDKAVPDEMYQGVLDPTNQAFIDSGALFKAAFGPVVQDWWSRLGNAQIGQLLNRGVRFPADLWFDILEDPRGVMFFDRPHARGLPASAPQLDPTTALAVATPTILQALGAPDFITFGSPKTMFHSGLTGFGILEGSPHNLVHNCVGGVYNSNPADQQGFMQSNLSPVDPLFFLHHSNIDRLWDVWTRKQLAMAAVTRRSQTDFPILPDGYLTPAIPKTDWAGWSKEPFLFYVTKDGTPVGPAKAGDYASIGALSYNYQPGSGEEIVPVTSSAMLRAASRRQARSFMTEVALPAGRSGHGGAATLQSTPSLLASAQSGARLHATVTLSLSPDGHRSKFHFLLNAPEGTTLATADRHRIGTFAMFGHHVVPPATISFTVPLTEAVAGLRRRNLLRANAPVTISLLVEEHEGHAPRLMAAMPERAPAAHIVSVVVDAR